MTECKFIMKNRSFKMVAVFSPIFVAETKITFVYNFVTPFKVQFCFSLQNLTLTSTKVFMIFINQVIMLIFCFKNNKVLNSMRNKVLEFHSHHFFHMVSFSLSKVDLVRKHKKRTIEFLKINKRV